MKTIGTVINTVIVVFGMLCSLIAGAFVGYSMAKDENRRPTYNQYPFRNVYYRTGYSKGYSNARRDYERKQELKEEYGEEEENEDI